MESPAPMNFDAFIETAWSDHGDRPQEVADRLAASLHWVTAGEHIPPFARLVTHVYGEHLGLWTRGVELLESMQALPAYDHSPNAATALLRGTATLRYVSGDEHAIAALSSDDRIVVLATAAAALAGRGDRKGALAAYEQALAVAGSVSANASAPGAAAIRALAVGGNNLAATLEETKDRSAGETAGMLMAARAALTYWKQAGTWLEEERAEYRLARSYLQAGDSAAALHHAQRCADICRGHGAPAIERFFATVVLALAQRAAADIGAYDSTSQAALALFEAIEPSERAWCADALSELRAAP
jgi:hypothetical protein